MEIRKINDYYYYVDDGMVRCFLILGDKCNLLVDSGNDEGVKELVQKEFAGELKLINTHCDVDHIADNRKFKEALMHKDEMHYYPYDNAKEVRDGDVLDTGYVKLKVIHTPGHTPGSISLFDEQSGILISGDPIQMNSAVFMFGEKRNIPLNVESLRKLAKIEGIKTILPSHGTMPLNPSIIQKLIESYEHLDDYPKKDVEFFKHHIHEIDLGYVSILVD